MEYYSKNNIYREATKKEAEFLDSILFNQEYGYATQDTMRAVKDGEVSIETLIEYAFNKQHQEKVLTKAYLDEKINHSMNATWVKGLNENVERLRGIIAEQEKDIVSLRGF